HDNAFNKARVLHHDISVGNILITKGKEILIDWDLLKCINKEPSKCDKQFMLASLVMNNNVLHTFVDDLESVFYVIIWLML
ncbi:hypothetical protein PILCRDRAFT_50863, partial [Piloderma croceum F 1598]